MMQMFMFGLLLAAVSGVTVVAFRHPNGFATLFPYLLALVSALFVGFTVWHIAIELTWTRMLVFLPQETLAEATNSISQIRPPYAWVAFWYLGVVGFLWINLRLPRFLQLTDEHDDTLNGKN